MNRPQPANSKAYAANNSGLVGGPLRPAARRRWSAKKKWTILSVAALVLIAGIFVWEFFAEDALAGIKRDKYQAVFLTNGQVYFGKLTGAGDSYMKLENVYYLEGEATQVQVSEDAPAQTAQKLTKLGTELHKPEDKMMINRTQVVFFQNITDDGAVGKAIKDYTEK